MEHASYRQSAFQYVCMLQDVHSQKQYELIEPVSAPLPPPSNNLTIAALMCCIQIIGYIGDVSTFLHQAYDSALSIKSEQQVVQFKVQIVSLCGFVMGHFIR